MRMNKLRERVDYVRGNRKEGGGRMGDMLVKIGVVKEEWVGLYIGSLVKGGGWVVFFFFFKQKSAYDVPLVTGVQTCALPIYRDRSVGQAGLRVRNGTLR